MFVLCVTDACYVYGLTWLNLNSELDSWEQRHRLSSLQPSSSCDFCLCDMRLDWQVNVSSYRCCFQMTHFENMIEVCRNFTHPEKNWFSPHMDIHWLIFRLNMQQLSCVPRGVKLSLHLVDDAGSQFFEEEALASGEHQPFVERWNGNVSGKLCWKLAQIPNSITIFLHPEFPLTSTSSLINIPNSITVREECDRLLIHRQTRKSGEEKVEERREESRWMENRKEVVRGWRGGWRGGDTEAGRRGRLVFTVIYLNCLHFILLTTK